MKTLYLYFILLLTFSIQQLSATNISTHTTWGPGIVTISENIVVEDGVVLNIVPATSIVFVGYYQLKINGTLKALGTEAQPIIFTRNDTTGLWLHMTSDGAWGGLKFDNSYEYGGAKGVMDNNEKSVLSYCVLRNSKSVDTGFGAYSGFGGAILIANFDNIDINNCTIEYCGAEFGGAIAMVEGSSPSISNTNFNFNRSSFGGGIYIENQSNPTLINLNISNNFANREGGAIHSSNLSAPNIINCLINNNLSSKYGGGIFLSTNTQPTLTNNTIVYNKAGIYGGGIYCKSNSQPVIFNSIVYYNEAAFFEGAQVYLNSDNNLTIYYSNIEGGKDTFGGYSFAGIYYSCTDFPPLFVQNSSFAGIDYQKNTLNFDLLENSNCINAGVIDTSGLHLPALDLKGRNRIYGGKIDVGAYENQTKVAPPDFVFEPANLFVSAKTGKTQLTQVKILKVNIDNLNITQENLKGLEAPFSAQIENNIITISLNSGKAGIYKDTLYVESQYGTKTITIDAQFGEIGDVWGSWGEDTIKVIGDITVPADKTLIIEPGTLVEFEGYYGMHVLGRLLVVGLPSDSVCFTPQNKQKGWKGVRFQENVSLDSSKIMYAIFEYRKPISIDDEESGSAILVDNFRKLSVIHSAFRNNIAGCGAAIQCVNLSPAVFYRNTFINNTSNSGGAIYISNSSPTLQQLYFTRNSATSGGAIYIQNSSNPNILNVVAENNNAFRAGGAIFSATTSQPRILNAAFSGNTALEGAGIYLNESSPKLINLTIAHNISSRFGGGVFCGAESHPEIINSVIYYNKDEIGSNQIYLENILVASSPTFDYCIVEGGIQLFSGNGSTVYNSAKYTHSTDTNPLFIGGNRFPYRLKTNSPCKNASNPQSSTFNIPPTDYLGSSRFAEGNVDIGAFEFAGNYAPITNIVEKQIQVKERLPFTLKIAEETFSDIDTGDSLRISIATPQFETLTWIAFDKTIPQFTGLPSNSEVGLHQFTIAATDDYGATAFSKVKIEVLNVNDPPTLLNSLTNITIHEQSPFSFTIPQNTFNDIDAGDVLTLTATSDGKPLPEWLKFDSQTNTLSGTPLLQHIGSLQVTITAKDKANALIMSTFTIKVEYINHTPQLQKPTADFLVQEDTPFSFTIPADMFTDINPDDILTVNLIYLNTTSLPAWLSFNKSTKTLSGTPKNSDIGIYSFQISAFDDEQATANDVFIIEVINTNDAPIFTGNIVSPHNLFENTYYEFSLNKNNFSDLDAFDILVFTAKKQNGDPLPDWLTFNIETLTLSGTPPHSAIGVTTVRVYATDRMGANVFVQFALYVQEKTAIIDTDNEEIDLQLSPNPSEGKVFVQLTSSKINFQNISLCLFNNAGSLVEVLTPENTSIENNTFVATLNLEKYAKGFYFIRFVSDKGLITKKLIIR